MRLFYAPTKTNMQLLAKLQKMPEIDKAYEFVALPNVRKEIVEMLGQIKENERAAALFGDGKTHDCSHFFTAKRRLSRGLGGIELKVNLDYHDDNQSDGPFFATHMDRTRHEQIEIIVPDHENNKVERLFELVGKAKERGLRFKDGEVAVTIDLDGFTGFPVLHEWIFQNTINIIEAIKVISELGRRILRLDVCGLIEGMPDFNLVPVDLGKPPSIDLLRSVSVKFGGKNPRSVGEAMAIASSCRPVSQGELDHVGSYALRAYSGILGTFAKACA